MPGYHLTKDRSRDTEELGFAPFILRAWLLGRHPKAGEAVEGGLRWELLLNTPELY